MMRTESHTDQISRVSADALDYRLFCDFINLRRNVPAIDLKTVSNTVIEQMIIDLEEILEKRKCTP